MAKAFLRQMQNGPGTDFGYIVRLLGVENIYGILLDTVISVHVYRPAPP